MDNIFLKLIKIIHEAALVINARAEINSCNQAFNDLSGFSMQQLSGQSPCTLLDTNGSLQLEEWLEHLNSNDELKPRTINFKNNTDSYQQFLIRPIIVKLEKESMLILIFDLPAENQINIHPHAAQSLIDSFNSQRIKIHTLEEELQEDESIWKNDHPDLMSVLRDVDSTLAQLNQSLSKNEEKIDLKSSIVEVMKLTTSYWKETTHTNKAELARHSGLWKVYTNEDGWDRTQTMDRYLNLSLLPRYPRQRQVCRTAEFVLSELSVDNKSRHALEHALANLRQLS